MKRKSALLKGVFVLILAIFTFASAQSVVPARLSIDPPAAITDDKIRIECSTDLVSDVAAVQYAVTRNGEDFVQLSVLCKLNDKFREFNCVPTGCDFVESTCDRLVVKDLLAKRDTMEGDYRCKVSQVDTSFNKHDGETATSFRLTVGDKTPPIESLSVKNLATGLEISNRTADVPAGTNITVRCQTRPASPEPAFVVSITGRENRTNLTVGHVVEFHERVPREMTVTFVCEAFNGFGRRQTRSIVLYATYPAIPSDVTIPSEAAIQMETDIQICAARNHPSRRLQISGMDAEMVEPGYPRYAEEPGMSYAFVRLSKKAAEVKDARLEFACGLAAGGMQPVQGSVALIATSTAMMTAGIVVAAIVAFLVIVGGIAYALKKRSTTPKPQAADKAGYDRVNQNDAAARRSRGPPTPSQMDELPSTDV